MKRTIDELEPPGAPIPERCQRGENLVVREPPHLLVEPREAELATKGTSPGGLDVDDSVRDVGVRVEIGRQLGLTEIDGLAGEVFWGERAALENL